MGKFISTKAVGKDERHDVTSDYKHPEGSEEERTAFRKAYAFGSKPDYQLGYLAVEEEGKGISLGISKTFALFLDCWQSWAIRSNCVCFL